MHKPTSGQGLDRTRDITDQFTTDTDTPGSLYQQATDWCRDRAAAGRKVTYRHFVACHGLNGVSTPSGTRFDSQTLDYAALTKLLHDLATYDERMFASRQVVR